MKPSLNLPKYRFISSILRNRILNGAYGFDGGKLPTEKKLASMYDVSLITIRNALGLLAKEGFIQRKAGKGTFVSNKIRKPYYPIYTGQIQDISRTLYNYKIEVLDINKIVPSEKEEIIRYELSEFLGIGYNEEIGLVQRIVINENGPINYIENYIPVNIIDMLSKTELKTTPILRILTNKCKLKIGSWVMHISFTHPTEEASKHLRCEEIDPCALVRIYSRYKNGKPSSITFSYTKAEDFVYCTKLNVRPNECL